MTRPVFGVDRDPLVVAELVRRGSKRRRRTDPPTLADPNPMVIVHGPDPAGRICRDCRFLVPKGGNVRTYYGCVNRGKFTSGPGTDHRVRWPACRLFEERP